MSFVCSWHLSQKEVQISTALSPLVGEPVGVKESEQERARDREREDMGRKYKERQGVKTKEVLYFTPVCGVDEGHVLKTQMCKLLPHWTLFLPVIHSGHPDHEPTTSRFPSRHGAPVLQVEQDPSHGETPL